MARLVLHSMLIQHHTDFLSVRLCHNMTVAAYLIEILAVLPILHV